MPRSIGSGHIVSRGERPAGARLEDAQQATDVDVVLQLRVFLRRERPGAGLGRQRGHAADVPRREFQPQEVPRLVRRQVLLRREQDALPDGDRTVRGEGAGATHGTAGKPVTNGSTGAVYPTTHRPSRRPAPVTRPPSPPPARPARRPGGRRSPCPSAPAALAPPPASAGTPRPPGPRPSASCPTRRPAASGPGSRTAAPPATGRGWRPAAPTRTPAASR